MSPSTHGIPAPDPAYFENSLGRKFEAILAQYPMLPLAGVLAPTLVGELMAAVIEQSGTAFEWGVAFEVDIISPLTGLPSVATRYRPLASRQMAFTYVDTKPITGERNIRVVYRLANAWHKYVPAT